MATVNKITVDLTLKSGRTATMALRPVPVEEGMPLRCELSAYHVGGIGTAIEGTDLEEVRAILDLESLILTGWRWKDLFNPDKPKPEEPEVGRVASDTRELGF